MSNSITIQVPVAGQPNSTEDPKIASNFTNLTAWFASPGITSTDLANSAITATQLATNAVTTAKIKDSTGPTDGVTTAKIATSAITEAKIASAAVTTDKIGSVAVTRSAVRTFIVPQYVTALPTSWSGTVNTTSGSSSVTLNTTTSGTITVGHPLTAAGIPSDSVVISVVGSAITLNRAATATATGVSATTGPQDADEIYYLADSSARVLWHLRYNASSSSAYKWEFIGGPSVQGLTGGSVTPVNTSWNFAPTAGPVVTGVPLAGDYEVTLGAYLLGIIGTTAAAYVAATSPTTLSAAISGTGTGTITVANGDLISVGDTLYVEGSTPAEQMTVSAVAGNTVTINARGVNGTTAQSHTTGANVYALALSSTVPTKGLMATLTNAFSGSRTFTRTGVPSGGRFAIAYRIGGSATSATISDISVSFRPVRVG
jgi:hypothetical protein